MFSNQTTRVYSDMTDLEGAIHALNRQAVKLNDEGHSNDAWQCLGAARALMIMATTRLNTQADFMAVFMAQLLDEPQKARDWKAAGDE